MMFKNATLYFVLKS